MVAEIKDPRTLMAAGLKPAAGIHAHLGGLFHLEEVMQVTGKTVEGQPVVKGLFRLFDSSGIPLSDIFNQCRLSGIQPDWQQFVKEATEAGWKMKTVKTRMSEALNDSHGKDYRDVVMGRLFGDA